MFLSLLAGPDRVGGRQLLKLLHIYSSEHRPVGTFGGFSDVQTAEPVGTFGGFSLLQMFRLLR